MYKSHLLKLLLYCNVYGIFSEYFLIKNVDFDFDQFSRHRTKEFYGHSNAISDVIIRRADYFTFSVELNSDYDGEKIQVILSFETKDDKVVIQSPSSKESNKWRLKQSNNGRRINVCIHIPPDAQVGVWNMVILLANRKGRVIEEMNTPNRIIVLFNPWSAKDAAYFPECRKLKEYVMNEKGFTYSYDFTRWQANSWVFGQFQPNVLNAILLAMDRGNLTAIERGDIVKVARELTALLSDVENKTNGVLRGKWEEPYEPIDGRPVLKPWEWTGSAPIYQQFYGSGGKPAGYGQCFVFAGILATAYRALGIASRPVTVLVSANTRKADLTVNIYKDLGCNNTIQECIWNFHVWVQAWFSRPDIGARYGGWQELDAVGGERFGPASTVAVRNSEMKNDFNNANIYETVNADVVTLSVDNETISVDTKRIGKSLLTKECGSNSVEVITDMYKPPENTTAERESYRKAIQSLGISSPSLNYTTRTRSSKHKIDIDIQIPEEKTIGSSVASKIFIRNSFAINKSLQVNIKATAMYYNGEVVADIKEKSLFITVNSSETKMIPFDIKPDDYIGKLRDENTIRIEVAIDYDNTMVYGKKLFSLETPKLKIIAPKAVNTNETFTVKVQLKNPLNRTLTDCYIAIEGTEIKRKVVRIKDIEELALRTTTIQLVALSPGTETIVVHFNADVLKMKGSTEVNVKGKKSYRFAKYVMKQQSRRKIVKGQRNEKNKDSDENSTIIERRRITRNHFECCEVVNTS